jgi:methylglutaconyl-CoA hydratase
MKNGNLYINIINGIATVEFFHPASNSMPGVLLQRMEKAFNDLNKDDTVKVIVLKSEKDRAFCAGASFDELLAIDNPTDGVAFFSAFGKVIQAMIGCKKPIIGRVQGKAVGGGVGLIAACDLALATESAAVKLSEISIGIGPFVVEPAISHKIGKAAMATLAFNPTRWQNAYWAKDRGLFAEIYENIKDLDKAVQILAEQWASYAPEAIRQLKKVAWEGTEHFQQLMEHRANICGHLVLSDATKNALDQFKNKT